MSFMSSLQNHSLWETLSTIDPLSPYRFSSFFSENLISFFLYLNDWTIIMVWHLVLYYYLIWYVVKKSTERGSEWIWKGLGMNMKGTGMIMKGARNEYEKGSEWSFVFLFLFSPHWDIFRSEQNMFRPSLIRFIS